MAVYTILEISFTAVDIVDVSFTLMDEDATVVDKYISVGGLLLGTVGPGGGYGVGGKAIATKVVATVAELRKIKVTGFQAHHILPEYLGKILGYSTSDMTKHPGILISHFKHFGRDNIENFHHVISSYLPYSTKYKKVSYTAKQKKDSLKAAYFEFSIPELYDVIEPLIKKVK